MEKNNLHWDFECPQFVDFVAGLESSSPDDIFFDCKDTLSAEDCMVVARSPQVSDNEKCLTEEAENKLLDKMMVALSIIQNTPKLKKDTVKGTLLAGKFDSSVSSKSVIKPKSALLPDVNLPRSKSFADLNKITTEKSNVVSDTLRKRSSSLGDLRAHRKQKYPVTPICLKRTIVKAKAKSTKTSEEIELEKIAELQKQLIRHLRYNERTLKKLNLKQRQCIVPKPETKPRNIKEDKGLNIGKCSVTEKEPRRNIQTLNHVALKNVAKKIDNIISRKTESNTSVSSGINPSVSSTSSISSEVNHKRKIQANSKKNVFHPGLKFHPSVKKNTVVKPFNFLNASKSQNANAEHTLGMSAVFVNGFEDKENISVNKPLTAVRKTQAIQNVKCPANDLSQSNQTRRIGNPRRGLTLFENLLGH